MIIKRLSAAFFVLLFIMFPLSGATVSFLIVETGLQEGSPKNEFSNIWETGLMDAFFEAGHIVSNAHILRLTLKPETELPDEVRRSFNEAGEGGAAFFILALLDYQGSSISKVPKPPVVSLRLFKIKPYKLLFEKQIADLVHVSPREELAQAKKTARVIIPHLGER